MELTVLDYSSGTVYTIFDAPAMSDSETIEAFIVDKLDDVRLENIHWIETQCHIYHHCNPTKRITLELRRQ